MAPSTMCGWLITRRRPTGSRIIIPSRSPIFVIMCCRTEGSSCRHSFSSGAPRPQDGMRFGLSNPAVRLRRLSAPPFVPWPGRWRPLPSFKR